jgi:hypothetical protein
MISWVIRARRRIVACVEGRRDGHRYLGLMTTDGRELQLSLLSLCFFILLHF